MSISVSPFNPVQQSGCRAKNPPDLVIASRAPTTLDYGYFLGTIWLFTGNAAYMLAQRVISPTTKSATWIQLAAGSTDNFTAGSFTATSGGFTATTAGQGFKFNATTASGAASGAVVTNSRAGSVTFTGVSIAAGATLTLTMTNSFVTASTTQISYSLQGATTGAALTIESVTNSSGSSAVVITNGTGATTTTANITLVFLVLN